MTNYINPSMLELSLLLLVVAPIAFAVMSSVQQLA